MRKVLHIWFFLVSLSGLSQYYNQAGLTAIETTRTAYEGDHYLDTINIDYRIGLTHGKLGSLKDHQAIDSFALVGDTLIVSLENSSLVKLDVSSIAGGGASVGDIKTGIQSGDHDGWYVLDGRAVSTLSAKAQGNAVSLGYSTNLPNLAGRMLKTRGSSEALGSTGGANTVTLIQANMPNYTLPAAVSSGVSSTHTHIAIVDSAGKHAHTAAGQNLELALKNYSNSGSNTDTAVVKGSPTPFNTDPNGDHTHNLNVAAAGDHNHTISVSTGGSSTPIDIRQPYFVVRTFIFLDN